MRRSTRLSYPVVERTGVEPATCDAPMDAPPLRPRSFLPKDARPNARGIRLGSAGRTGRAGFAGPNPNRCETSVHRVPIGVPKRKRRFVWRTLTRASPNFFNTPANGKQNAPGGMAFRGVRVTRKVGTEPTFLCSCSSAGQVGRALAVIEAVIQPQRQLQAERAHAEAGLPWRVLPLMDGGGSHLRIENSDAEKSHPVVRGARTLRPQIWSFKTSCDFFYDPTFGSPASDCSIASRG